MYKCLRCSSTHTGTNDCGHPVNIVRKIKYKNWEFLVIGCPIDGSPWLDPYLQIIFRQGNDLWYGRKWRLSPYMTRSEIVQTAFMAVLACEEHEAREAFKYMGAAVFGPHFSVDALVQLCEQGKLDVR